MKGWRKVVGGDGKVQNGIHLGHSSDSSRYQEGSKEENGVSKDSVVDACRIEEAGNSIARMRAGKMNPWTGSFGWKGDRKRMRRRKARLTHWAA